MRFVAGFHERGGLQVVLTGVLERRAVDHAIDEVALECVNAVSGETFAGVRVVEQTRRLAEELQREVAFEVELEVTFAAINADETEGVARVGSVGFVEA